MNQQEAREFQQPRSQSERLFLDLQVQNSRKSSSHSDRSRSRSRSRSLPRRNSEQEQKNNQSGSFSKNQQFPRDANGGSHSNQIKQKPKLKKGSSKMNTSKEQKTKKKRVPKQLITDFTDFLPESLIHISKTSIQSKIRIGQRFQASIPSAPEFSAIERPVQPWLLWSGFSNPQDRPSEDHIRRFKEILGQNRTEEDFIMIRQRLGIKSWSRVLEVVQSRRTEYRWNFHQTQRNKT